MTAIVATATPRHRSRVAALALLAPVAALAACARTSDGGADSALARDLTLAASPAATRSDTVAFADTSVTARQLPAQRPVAAETRRPVAPAPAPRERVPRPTPAVPSPEPAPRQAAEAPPPQAASDPALAPTAPAAGPTAAPTGAGHTFGIGTGMVLTTTQPICSKSNKAGDRFIATLQEPVKSLDGGTLPAGTDVVFELASIMMGAGDHGRVELTARSISLEGYLRPIAAEVAWIDAALERHTLERAPGTPSDASKVGKGAVTGAILGHVLGGRSAKGTIIGAAAGAAIGAAGARSDAMYEGCLPKGTVVRMRLTGPLSVGV